MAWESFRNVQYVQIVIVRLALNFKDVFEGNALLTKVLEAASQTTALLEGSNEPRCEKFPTMSDTN